MQNISQLKPNLGNYCDNLCLAFWRQNSAQNPSPKHPRHASMHQPNISKLKSILGSDRDNLFLVFWRLITAQNSCPQHLKTQNSLGRFSWPYLLDENLQLSTCKTSQNWHQISEVTATISAEHSEDKILHKIHLQYTQDMRVCNSKTSENSLLLWDVVATISDSHRELENAQNTSCHDLTFFSRQNIG